MTVAIHAAVLARDGSCVAVKLGEDPATCQGRLTLDHVKDQPAAGPRAKSDCGHLVTLCEFHHTGLKAGSNWATSHRPALRDYLAELEK